MEFETLLKVIVATAAAVGFPLMVYVAIAATRATWGKGRLASATDTARLAEELEQLRGRLNDTETYQARVMELEERLDFLERLLAQAREAERLPRG